MKIAKVKTIFADCLFVRIHTDDGLTGLGITGSTFAKSVEAAIKEYEEYLIGKDPLDIEKHWQYLYRYQFYRGGMCS